MNKYIIQNGESKYIKDSLTNRELLVNEIQNVVSLPSNGKDFTLYVLSNGKFYYNLISEFRQVEPVEQKVVKQEKIKS